VGLRWNYGVFRVLKPPHGRHDAPTAAADSPDSPPGAHPLRGSPAAASGWGWPGYESNPVTTAGSPRHAA
jgi:hypothetical protein